jgi:hypothetical protein
MTTFGIFTVTETGQLHSYWIPTGDGFVVQPVFADQEAAQQYVDREKKRTNVPSLTAVAVELMPANWPEKK